MNKRKLFALLVTISFLVLIFYKIDIHNLVQTFKIFNFKNLLQIIILYMFGMYLRGFRFKAVLLDNKKYSVLELGENFIMGSFLNIFLPARGGDLYRAYKLGSDKDERKMKILGSILVERTFDGICVFCILLFAVLMYCKQQWIINVTYSVGFLFFGCLIVFWLIFKFNKIDFICEYLIKLVSNTPEKINKPLINIIKNMKTQLNSFIEGFSVLNSFKYTLKTFVWTAIPWLLECYIAYLIINSFNLHLGFAAALFVISLISFSTMIPSASVFIGPYQYAYILALGIFGIDKSSTLAISTVHQSILLISQGLMCLFIVLKNNFLLKK